MQASMDEHSALHAGRCPCCEQPVTQRKLDEIKIVMEATQAAKLRMETAIDRLNQELQGLHQKLQERKGRPPKPAVPGERISLGLKVTSVIKSRLDKAARETGRTQSQEAEIRIERSFDRQDLLSEVLSLAFGKELAGIVIMLAFTMDAAGRHGDLVGRNSDWKNDPHALGQAVDAAIELLRAVQPPAKLGRRKRNMPSFGHRTARAMINAVCGNTQERNPFLPSDVDAIRTLLGPIGRRIGHAISEPSRQVGSGAAADAVLALINSNPKTPSRQALVEAIEKQFRSSFV